MTHGAFPSPVREGLSEQTGPWDSHSFLRARDDLGGSSLPAPSILAHEAQLKAYLSPESSFPSFLLLRPFLLFLSGPRMSHALDAQG